MRRTIFNLFLIVIICFLASFIPLSNSYFKIPQNILPNFTLSKPSRNTEAISGNYETNFDDTHLYNPTNIEFTMIGDFDKGTFSLGDSHDMVLEVFNKDTLIKKYSNTEFITGLLNTSDVDYELKYSCDISQENLDLNQGHYNFKFYSTAANFKEVTPFEVSVYYLSTSKYISSKNTIEEGKRYVTLYFPDKNYEYLVPISRKIPATNKHSRKVLDNLLLGPKPTLSLHAGSPIPEVPKIWVSKGVATLSLPWDIGIYDQDSVVSQFSLNSFINTLTSIDGIDKVQFLRGGKKVKTFFNGTYVKKPFEKNNSPKVYLGLQTSNERILLVPINLEENIPDMDQLVHNIFNSLKNNVVNDIHYENLFSIVPNSVDLIDYEYSNNILTLNLSDDFLTVYGERDDLQKMMLDGILYSFTSISNVSKVSIKVNGNTVDSFNGISISQSMPAPKFINIEAE
ncbi:GerMN domain-containing protein [Wukongibacter baidiensis]|uniref:GerMN domain-containing protein n=1 Tax=Wukongibacter baidiensis TaxID=1723361 RepID=UPI003D7F87D2